MENLLGKIKENLGTEDEGFISKLPFHPSTKVALVVIVLLLLISITMGVFVLGHLYRMDRSINIQQENLTENHHLLLSMIDEDLKRRNTILFMRDQILREWKENGISGDKDKAYLIAESTVIEAEKYDTVDPLFLLAIQSKETIFRDDLKSPAGAIGLCQIMPTTGRMLTKGFQLEYSEENLYKIRTNIKLAAKYVDILYQDYPDYNLVLAGYNGGYRQIYHYRSNSPDLAGETKDYVVKVMSKFEGYKKSYKGYYVGKKA